MNTSRRWMNLMRFSLNVAVSLQTIRIRSERTPFSNGGHSTIRNRSKLAQKGSAKPFMRKAYYLHAYASVPEARAGIGAWLHFYNEERLHQAHGYRTPRQIYEMQCPWTGSAAPNGSASPVFPSKIGNRGNAHRRPHAHRHQQQQGFGN
jgi:hypothetical protein